MGGGDIIVNGGHGVTAEESFQRKKRENNENPGN